MSPATGRRRAAGGAVGAAARALLLAAALAATAGFRSDAGDDPDPVTLLRKHIVGYQGWFACDAAGRGPWVHWFRDNLPAPRNMTFDMWPDTSELDADELCPTGFRRADGSEAHLFSALNPKTVDRHFRWMREYDIDGAALQRFVVALRRQDARARIDTVLANARAAAERHRRVFFLMYDVSGAEPATAVADLLADWRRLAAETGLTESPMYLRHRGRPLVAVWGLGFKSRPLGAVEAAGLVRALQQGGQGAPATTVMGGVPAGWRTLAGDARPEPGWAAVYRALDVISPWSVGRFADEAGADAFKRQRLLPDMAETLGAGIDYMPVVFPGFSWHNLQHGRAPANQIRRRCGAFYLHQLANALDAGALMLYSAMFDEVDEGTALFKVTARTQDLPLGAPLVALDADGCTLASDWYLRLAGRATAALRGERGHLDDRLPAAR